MSEPRPLPEKLLWTVTDCATACGVHRNTIWKRAKAGAFPKPIKWEGTTVWRREDVERFFKRLAG